MAIENARLWEAVRANEERIEKELRFAQRVQMALLPQELPKRLRTVDVAWHFEPARELGGDLYDFLAPEPNQLIVAVGDVSGKGVPAALYSVFAGEVRARPHLPQAGHQGAGRPGAMLTSINRILHERQLEEYYCTLCYAQFDLRQHTVTLANSGLPYPIRCSADGSECAQIDLPGVPLGSFGTTTLRRGRRAGQRRRRVRVLLRRHLRDVQRDRRRVRLVARSPRWCWRTATSRPRRSSGRSSRR